MVSFTVLSAPNISISFSGNSSAGLENSINCSASVVDGLVVLPDLMIEFHSIVISEENNSSLVYIFSPLRTSDRGQYTCTATISIPQAGITDLQTSTMESITVTSQSYIIDPLAIYCLILLIPHSSSTYCHVFWSAGVSSGPLIIHSTVFWDSVHSHLCSGASARGRYCCHCPHLLEQGWEEYHQHQSYRSKQCSIKDQHHHFCSHL